MRKEITKPQKKKKKKKKKKKTKNPPQTHHPEKDYVAGDGISFCTAGYLGGGGRLQKIRGEKAQDRGARTGENLGYLLEGVGEKKGKPIPESRRTLALKKKKQGLKQAGLRKKRGGEWTCGGGGDGPSEAVLTISQKKKPQQETWEE